MICEQTQAPKAVRKRTPGWAVSCQRGAGHVSKISEQVGSCSIDVKDLSNCRLLTCCSANSPDRARDPALPSISIPKMVSGRCMSGVLKVSVKPKVPLTGSRPAHYHKRERERKRQASFRVGTVGKMQLCKAGPSSHNLACLGNRVSPRKILRSPAYRTSFDRRRTSLGRTSSLAGDIRKTSRAVSAMGMTGTAQPGLTTLGFVGIGIMGLPMAT